MKYGVFSCNEWLYPDTDVNGGKKKIELSAAKNSFANVQILLNDVKQDMEIGWKSENLAKPEINRLIPIFAELNTGDDEDGFTVKNGTPAPYATRQAPFWVYDAFEPIKNIEANEETVALYLRWNTKNINDGDYNGILTIGDTEISVSLRVYNVAVPHDETLRLTNWICVEDMANFHGVELWSDEHWEMVKKYGEVMRECRQTDFYLPHTLVEHQLVDGVYQFDFSKFEKLAKLYFNLGFSHIEIAPYIYRENWHYIDFVCKINGEVVNVLSDEGLKFLNEYHTALYAFLKKNGWVEKAVLHIADEPHEKCADSYNRIAKMVKEIIPDIPLIEAVEHPAISAIDIYVPKNNGYIAHISEYEQKRNEGYDLWYYTCCFPGGNYLNRVLDFEVIRTRYLHWANKLYNFKGYLHWGFNIYNVVGNPFEIRATILDDLDAIPLPCGDTHIVYPKGDKVLHSVRLEMMRSGVEDYELLCMLDKKDNEKYKAVIAGVITSFTKYEKDINVFEKAYKNLLESLS